MDRFIDRNCYAILTPAEIGKNVSKNRLKSQELSQISETILRPKNYFRNSSYVPIVRGEVSTAIWKIFAGSLNICYAVVSLAAA